MHKRCVSNDPQVAIFSVRHLIWKVEYPRLIFINISLIMALDKCVCTTSNSSMENKINIKHFLFVSCSCSNVGMFASDEVMKKRSREARGTAIKAIALRAQTKVNFHTYTIRFMFYASTRLSEFCVKNSIFSGLELNGKRAVLGTKLFNRRLFHRCDLQR